MSLVLDNRIVTNPKTKNKTSLSFKVNVSNDLVAAVKGLGVECAVG